MIGGVELGRLIDFDEARQAASALGWREKVLAYVTRSPGELLVLEHSPEFADAGVQVPAGGIDSGEEPGEAVVREVAEETGLVLAGPVYLESREWPTEAPSRIRHYFWLVAPAETPDSWSHVVRSKDGDDGLIFTLTFVNRRSAGLFTGHGFESGLRELECAVDEDESSTHPDTDRPVSEPACVLEDAPRGPGDATAR
ncbi:MAG: NUDIX domain-containing protein [Microbacterium sp.]|uniref:NUDIX domain-containing protein n=1 Tax=Microbacterium sp. TaxID=51671 RepID=UPI003BAF11E9